MLLSDYHRCLAYDVPHPQLKKLIGWCDKRESCARALALRSDQPNMPGRVIKYRVCEVGKDDAYIPVGTVESEIVGDLRNECDELRAKLAGASKVVASLVEVARAAWNAADNGLGVLAEDGIELRVSPVGFDAISDALGVLDMLPDDKPGFTLNGPARAEWALRNLLCNAT